MGDHIDFALVSRAAQNTGRRAPAVALGSRIFSSTSGWTGCAASVLRAPQPAARGWARCALARGTRIRRDARHRYTRFPVPRAWRYGGRRQRQGGVSPVINERVAGTAKVLFRTAPARQVSQQHGLAVTAMRNCPWSQTNTGRSVRALAIHQASNESRQKSTSSNRLDASCPSRQCR